MILKNRETVERDPLGMFLVQRCSEHRMEKSIALSCYSYMVEPRGSDALAVGAEQCPCVCNNYPSRHSKIVLQGSKALG